MRILLVGMHNSPHLHRWVRMIDDGRATILLFPVLRTEVPLPPEFKRIPLEAVTADLAPGVWIVEPADIGSVEEARLNADRDFVLCTHTFVHTDYMASPARLLAVINAYRPDLLHSLETQLAGYLCLDTLKQLDRSRPPWIASSWGSDLLLFHRFERHRNVLRRFCTSIDYFLPDAARDLTIARRLGYAGPTLEAMPATGGIDVDRLAAFSETPPSARKSIIVKGYHNWAGRSLLALSALVLAREQLRGFSIGILVPGPQPATWAARMADELNIDIEPLPYLPHPDDAMRRMAGARAVIGISISDGMPTMTLEAMTVGAFPIQSISSCADEWLVDGETGRLVPPDDTRAIAHAVVDVLTDDRLVDEAASRNLTAIRRRWNIESNRERIWDIYRRVAATLTIGAV
ncbi:glycosyltransferase [Parvibaculum sp.]|uniref:glycosyltransferase n=1 Tax=Parvibaculum sp. TaxID=2024848 RepID=UPI002C59811D|nr:glycosyltransferase [Parvibaculum sp.]HUD50884.1 glycosyltransferase [Parvibaculum sp.]